MESLLKIGQNSCPQPSPPSILSAFILFFCIQTSFYISKTQYNYDYCICPVFSIYWYRKYISSWCCIVIFKFLFYIEVQLINSVVLVSCVQQNDPVIYIHVSIPFLSPLRLLQNIEQHFLCYTVGPCWLYILNTAVS